MVTDLQETDRACLRAEAGHDLSLSCDCRMSDTRAASLYSIKWYRDDKEFFRFIPQGEMVDGMVVVMCYNLPRFSPLHHLPPVWDLC